MMRPNISQTDPGMGTEPYYARLGWEPIERASYLGAAVTVMARDLA